MCHPNHSIPIKPICLVGIGEWLPDSLTVSMQSIGIVDIQYPTVPIGMIKTILLLGKTPDTLHTHSTGGEVEYIWMISAVPNLPTKIFLYTDY